MGDHFGVVAALVQGGSAILEGAPLGAVLLVLSNDALTEVGAGSGVRAAAILDIDEVVPAALVVDLLEGEEGVLIDWCLLCPLLVAGGVEGGPFLPAPTQLQVGLAGPDRLVSLPVFPA